MQCSLYRYSVVLSRKKHYDSESSYQVPSKFSTIKNRKTQFLHTEEKTFFQLNLSSPTFYCIRSKNSLWSPRAKSRRDDITAKLCDTHESHTQLRRVKERPYIRPSRAVYTSPSGFSPIRRLFQMTVDARDY